MVIKILDMKKIFLMLAVLSALFLGSCQKFDNEKPLTFDVYLDSTTFKAGDPVTFKFKGGDANQISYYSGEIGNDYEYRDKERKDEIKEVFYSFSSHNVIGWESVEVMVSNDFNGSNTWENVEAATWNRVDSLAFDGTNKYKWSPVKSWSSDKVFTSSGYVNLSPFMERGQPFYVAIKFKADPQLNSGIIPAGFRFGYDNVLVETIGGNFLSYITKHSDMSWNFVSRYADAAHTLGTNNYVMSYYPTSSPQYGKEFEKWTISKKIESRDISLGASNSITLKQYVDPPIESHTHFYETPGTYKVVFLASNATVSNTQQVIKELEITVTP